MTLRLREIDGRLVEVSVVPRAEIVVGVLMSPERSTSIRRVVHADLLRRAVERRRGTASVVPLGDVPGGLVDVVSNLNCRPLQEGGGRCQVVVGAGEASADAILRCSPPDDGEPLPDLSGADLRHALLARDGGARLGEAERWQRAVAAWAEWPSKPMCAEYVERAHAAIDDDLDTPRLLQVLRELEEHPELPPGCKFETFAHLDALAGLDLVSLVGQPG